MQDGFLNGQRPKNIQQRILENNHLTKQQAFNQSRQLNLAEQKAGNYEIVAATSEASSPIFLPTPLQRMKN